MLRALLPLLLLILSSLTWGQDTGTTTVTKAQLDAAIAEVTANLAEDDPARARLITLYETIQTSLQTTERFSIAQETFAQARAAASREAAAINSSLTERQLAMAAPVGSLEETPLDELAQLIQVSQAELEARKAKLAEIRDEINGMPARAAEVRSRLTRLGSLIPDLQARLALLPRDSQYGSEGQANVWLAAAQGESAVVEKAALDEELLSQPMRLQLLAARQDRARQDISGLDRSLQAMERRANMLLKGEVSEAHAAAEQEVVEAKGKHQLVQELADVNATLSGSFIKRGEEIEQARESEQVAVQQAERLESDLTSIVHKLNVLGMSTAVGHILREQQVQLPTQRVSKKQIAAVSELLTDSSVRQIELEDDRRKLVDVGQFVDALVEGLDADTALEIRPDLLELARKQRELVKQALDLEGLYSGALGNWEFNLYRYQRVVKKYREFIDERLLWIPSRDPFSLFRVAGLPAQLDEIVDAERWLREIRLLPQELERRPLLAFALLVVLVLVYLGPRIRARIVISGRAVGYVRTDTFSNTMVALGLSIVQSIRWPLLMWLVGRLFEMPESDAESDLALALHFALSQGAQYFWALEMLRVILMPKGLVASHFRWPAQRTALYSHGIVVLERTFLPAVILVFLTMSLYPAEVGGALAAVGVILLLLSLSYFFRNLPRYLQSKVGMLFTDNAPSDGYFMARVLRQLLVWVPLAATVAVVFGYIYTAAVLSLLLARTVAALALVFLFNELAMRWLRMTRRRMVVNARAEAAQAAVEESDGDWEDDLQENDPELLSDEGTKLINLLTLLGLLAAIMAIWAEVIPALSILDSVQLWHRTGVVDGVQAVVPVTLGDIAVAAAVAVLGWFALRRIPSLLEIFLRKKVGVHPASAYAATRVLQYAATTILVVGIMSAVGGSWSQIQWAVAALSVGIGFGLQEIVANFISGLIILFEQPIRVGDTVTVGTTSGRVTKIQIRATTIRDFDRRELLVPNKEFITQQLLNWSLSDQVTRWIVEVGVAYGSDLDLALEQVREAVHAQPLILDEPEPIVTFEEFGDNSLLIRARFFMEKLDERQKLSSDLRLEIHRRLNEHGIVVAFPQRDVHLDASQPLEIRMVKPHQEEGGA